MEGKIFDDYIVLRFVERKNNNNYYLVKCNVCGHEKIIGMNNIKKQDNHHSKYNCKYDFYKSYIGEQYGDYICEEIQYDKVNGYQLLLKCIICGHIKFVRDADLRDYVHSPTLCGDDYYDNLIGQVMADQIIISRSGKRWNDIMFNCKCKKCGVESRRSLNVLKKGIMHGRECIKQIPDSVIKNHIIMRWYNMYERCNNPNNTNYMHYGGRGIKLLYEYPIDLYMDFHEELKEHAEKYGIRNSTFDRIDVNGNYEKDNLRITTQTVQSINTTRKRIFIIEKDDERIISDSAMACGNYLGINGRSLGNVVRGASKSSGGWKLYRIVNKDECLEDIIENEGVTTNLIVS